MLKTHLITGATGLLGSHIAEQLVHKGEKVRAVVRPSSDVVHLKGLGVDIVHGDLLTGSGLNDAFAGADIVYHCAARVSDWGPWKLFEAESVTSTKNLLTACRHAKVGRLLHVSSISVYGWPKTTGAISETTPAGQNFMMWDYYPQAKFLAENLIRDYERDWTIIRPSWMYGERDRITVQRLVPALKAGKIMIIGSGENLLNIIYAGDVAAGAILAAESPAAVGQVYNFSSEGEATQKKLLDTLTDALGLARVTKKIPFGLARVVALAQESFFKATFRPKPPAVTRRAIYLVGRAPQFSTAKAREQLGWKPQVSIEEGVRRTLKWLASTSNEPRP